MVVEFVNRRTFVKTSLVAGLGIPALSRDDVATQPNRYVYPETAEFKKLRRELKNHGLILTDFHIHIRGGMTPEMAAIRQKVGGIKSCVLENFGPEWPWKTSSDLDAFITSCKKVKIEGKPIRVGIQVNDRDWFRQIDRATFERLDYALADTMIMGVTKEGKPQRLWQKDVVIDDQDAWMQEYIQHNLQILDEPISILANPTYLPRCIAHLYDKLWTDKRMALVIAKAIDKRIALEIQLETRFARKRFLLKAKQMGAVFSFGSNNFTEKTKNVSNWLMAVRLLDLQQKDILTHPLKPVYPG
jgi:hypothetical protein